MKVSAAVFAFLPLIAPFAIAEDDGKLTIEIPAAVQATVAKEKGDAGKITEFKKVSEPDGTAYVVGITAQGRKYELSLDAAGRLLRKHLNEGEAGPRVLGIEGVPAKVRQTLLREAGGAAIGEIEERAAQTTYHTEVVIGGRRFRLEVDSEGVLRGKEYSGD